MLVKKKILVYWYYGRKDLLVPFISLQETFDWVFICYGDKVYDPVVDFPFPRYYWDEFHSPKALIKKIKPDAIIFLELSNMYSLSLNIYAKIKQIPTYILEHGLKLSYEYYATLAKNKIESSAKWNEIPKPKTSSINRKLKGASFFLKSLDFAHLNHLPLLINYAFNVYTKETDTILPKLHFPLRKASKYLLFSAQNFNYYATRDGVTESDVYYFGNPYLDKLIQQFRTTDNKNESEYYVLLDDGHLDTYGISMEQRNNFLQKLNEYSRKNNCQLYIKLHPSDYGRTDLILDDNIKYLEDCDMNIVFKNSKRNFGFSSTMALPLVSLQNIVLFSLNGSKIQDLLKQFGVKFMDYYNWSPVDLDHMTSSIDKQDIEIFTKQFLYINDGKSLQRLAEILNN